MFKNDNPDVRWENPNHPKDYYINPRGAAAVSWESLIKWIFEDGLVDEIYEESRMPGLSGLVKGKIEVARLNHGMIGITTENGEAYNDYPVDVNAHYDYEQGIEIIENIHRETEALYGRDKINEKDVTNDAIKNAELLLNTFKYIEERVNRFLEQYVRPRARRDGEDENENKKDKGGWDGKWGAEPLLILMKKYREYLNNKYKKYRYVQNNIRDLERNTKALTYARGGKKKVKSKTSKRKTSKKRGSKRKSRKN